MLWCQQIGSGLVKAYGVNIGSGNDQPPDLCRDVN